MSDFTEAQDTILARLEARGAVDKFDVFEDSVPVGHKFETYGPRTPYVTVTFGGKAQVQFSQQGITGTRDNMKNTSVGIEVVAVGPRAVRLIADAVRDELEGYTPSSRWGELGERLAGSYTVLKPESEVWPVRYASSVMFSATADA